MPRTAFLFFRSKLGRFQAALRFSPILEHSGKVLNRWLRRKAKPSNPFTFEASGLPRKPA
jgi:hypothetical protein